MARASLRNTLLSALAAMALLPAPAWASLDFSWARRGGGTNWDGAIALAVDSAGAGDIAVAGQLGSGSATFDSTVVSGDNFLARYDAAGNLLWVLPVVDGGSIEDLAFDPSGNILLTGSFSGSISIGTTPLTSAGAQDFYLAKYDSAGSPVWARATGASSDDKGLSVATDRFDNIVVSGQFVGTVSFGSFTLTSAGVIDGFVAKYTPAGSVVWAASEGQGSNDRARGVAVDGTDDIYVTGDFNGKVFLARYTSGGTRSWLRTSSGSVALAEEVVADGSGNAVITGNFGDTATFGAIPLTSAGSRDVFVAKYDASGNVQWAQRGGGSDDDRGLGVVTGSGNQVFAVGLFQDTASFDSTLATSVGQGDVYVATYDSLGNLTGIELGGGAGHEVAWGIGLSNGRIVISGWFDGSASFDPFVLTSAGSSDAFVVALPEPGSTALGGACLVTLGALARLRRRGGYRGGNRTPTKNAPAEARAFHVRAW